LTALAAPKWKAKTMAEPAAEATPDVVKGITVKVACPVCGARLEYQHEESEAWGVVSLTDYGIVELTAHDKGRVIGPHMQTHHADGTQARVTRQRAEWWASLAKRLDELGK
jgi:hypothetical protein